MYSAYGRSVRRNEDGSVTVKVEILNDRTQTSVRFQDYTGKTVAAIEAQIGADLQALAAAEKDVQLNTAVVGRLLGSI